MELIKQLQRYRDELGIHRTPNHDRTYLTALVARSAELEVARRIDNTGNSHLVSTADDMVVQLALSLNHAYERMIQHVNWCSEITPATIEEVAQLTMDPAFGFNGGRFRTYNLPVPQDGRPFSDAKRIVADLKDLCAAINTHRSQARAMTMTEAYELAYDTHSRMIDISPWPNGNDMMARLVMNWVEYEFHLLPSRISAEEVKSYVAAIQSAHHGNNHGAFRQYMDYINTAHIRNDIEAFIANTTPRKNDPMHYKPIKTRDKILFLLREDPTMSATQLATKVGFSAKCIEKHLIRMRQEGTLTRQGNTRTGQWIIHEKF
jgi:hypothetical protein